MARSKWLGTPRSHADSSAVECHNYKEWSEMYKKLIFDIKGLFNGFILNWEDEDTGFFGSIVVHSDSQGGVTIDSETLSSETLKKIFCKLIDSADII